MPPWKCDLLLNEHLKNIIRKVDNYLGELRNSQEIYIFCPWQNKTNIYQITWQSGGWWINWIDKHNLCFVYSVIVLSLVCLTGFGAPYGYSPAGALPPYGKLSVLLCIWSQIHPFDLFVTTSQRLSSFSLLFLRFSSQNALRSCPSHQSPHNIPRHPPLPLLGPSPHPLHKVTITVFWQTSKEFHNPALDFPNVWPLSPVSFKSSCAVIETCFIKLPFRYMCGSFIATCVNTQFDKQAL